MKFLADENVPQSIIAHFLTKGLDIVDSKATRLHQAPDTVVHAYAASQGRIIVTYDKDFLRLVSLQERVGVIILHFPGTAPRDVIPYIDELISYLTSHELITPYQIILSKDSLQTFI